MATTYTLINSSTLTTTTSSVTFSAIPNTYTDLKIVCSLRTVGAVHYDILNINFNSDTGSNYQTSLNLYNFAGAVGTGGASSKTAMNIAYINGDSSTADTFGNLEFYIPNYATTGQARSVSVDAVEENNSTSNYLMWLATSYWTNTANAINSIYFVTNSATSFKTGSTFYLYGIKNS